MSALGRPLALSIVNDYEIIVSGLYAMLEPYADRVRLVELERGGEPTEAAEMALYDTFAARRQSLERAVVYKSHGASDLVDALERVASGERVGLDHLPRRGREQASRPGLSVREREVLALVALGMSNRDVAAELYLSVDTIKTYVRRVFSKLGVKNRTQAALRAAGYELQPPEKSVVLTARGALGA